MERLYEKLELYSQSDYYGFHMPGHKRIPLFSDCFAIDITEIDGFDDLHHPEGILQEFQMHLAELYGSSASYMVVNGSTGGILAAISAVTELGGELLMARNCHKSAYHAAYLRNLKVHYVYPQLEEKWGFFSAVSPEDVDNCLKQHPTCKAVILVSPTYEGIVSNIREIAAVVHGHGGILIVDEAHGAHLPFLEQSLERHRLASSVSSGGMACDEAGERILPVTPSGATEHGGKQETAIRATVSAEEWGAAQSAVTCGADIVIQSVHKTLPCLTQTALLHVCGDAVLQKKVARYLSIYQTSSPSYVLLSSIEEGILWMEAHRETAWQAYLVHLAAFRARMTRLKWIHLYHPGRKPSSLAEKQPDWWKQSVISGYDCGKLVLGIWGKKNGGTWLYRHLLEGYHLQLEMCQPEYCIAMTSVMDPEEAFMRLGSALLELDQVLEQELGSKNKGQKPAAFQNSKSLEQKPAAFQASRSLEQDPGSPNRAQQQDLAKDGQWKQMAGAMAPMICYTAYEASQMEQERIALETCAGRISGETAYIYPPGVPIVVQGEVITEECVETLLAYRRYGFEIRGLEDQTGTQILVIRSHTDSI